MKVYKTTRIKPNKFKLVSDFQASYGVLSDKCILAGGSLRKMVDSSDVIQDYDLFFLSEDAIEQTRGKLLSLGFEVIFECSEMTTLRLESEKIQLIKLTIYDSVESILESFDFTACMAATDGVSIWFTTSFVKDVKRRELRLNKLSYPIATLKRFAKYVVKGYNGKKFAAEYVDSVISTEFTDAALEREYVD